MKLGNYLSLILLALWSCSDRSSKEVARLETILAGQVDKQVGTATWHSSAVGDRYLASHAVRTSEDGGARLVLQSGTILKMGPATILRFGKALDLVGEISVEQDATLDLAIGRVEITAGTRLRVEGTGDQGSLEVLVGAAQITRNGTDLLLEEGQRASFDTRLGSIQVSSREPDAGAPSEPPLDDAGPAEIDAGPLPTDESAPTFAHLALPAGQSAFIHDPAAPTNVRIEFANQCRDGLVELGGKSRPVRGRGSAIVRLPVGTHRYRVRCLDVDAVENGTIRVNRAAGMKRLPPRPSDNEVQADGLKYSVLYQGLLPNITFRWAAVAKTGAYTLHVAAEGAKEQTFPSNSNAVLIKSGQLAEGQYTYWFTDKGGRKSTPSTLRIAFDNTAEAGFIRTPRIGEAWGASLTIEGAAVKGWAASVGPHELALDGQYRFKATLEPEAGAAAIAIRFFHPARGAHYYVRRRP